VLQAINWLPRTEGTVRLGFTRVDGRTALSELHQSGAARVRFPRSHDIAPEAVLLNTAGGLTGGDRITIDVNMEAACDATITSAAAEKVYRSLGDPTIIDIGLRLDAGARCLWLPQPTILFNGSSLRRHTHVDMADDASLLAVEMLIFGRTAMGEEVHAGSCHDAWRVRRGGKLVFADTTRVSGAVAQTLARAATLDGARAMAMLLYVAPDAAARLDEVRALLDHASGTAGASTWNGLLLVRAVAHDARALQRDISAVVVALAGRPMPRVWQC
jgi:urease accessory protein